MAKPRNRVESPTDIEKLQKMLYETDEENERNEFGNESDVDEDDIVETRSEDSNSVQDISNEESEEDENENVEYFLGKDKVTKWRKNVTFKLEGSHKIIYVNTLQFGHEQKMRKQKLKVGTVLYPRICWI